jgi:hypothetical protein
MELISPRRAYDGWRDTVAYVTGESHPHGQAAAVRGASVNLVDAYKAAEAALAIGNRRAA